MAFVPAPLRFTSKNIRYLEDAEVAEAAESKVLKKRGDGLNKAAADLRLALRPFAQKAEWERIQNAPAIHEAVTSMRQSIEALDDELEPMISRGKELAMCHRRLQALKLNLASFLEPADNRISWYELNERSFRLVQSPLEVAAEFRLPNQIIMHPRVDGADTRFANMDKPLRASPLEKWLGILRHGEYKKAPNKEEWAYVCINELEADRNSRNQPPTTPMQETWEQIRPSQAKTQVTP